MNQDLTRGPVMRSMLLFAIPMILGDLLQQCYNVADTLIVGRFVGTDALAAVGSSYTLMTFLTSILLGLCMGSGALFSMHFGRRDGEGLRESLVSSFVLIAVVTVVLNAASFACLDLIRVFLQVPDQVLGADAQLSGHHLYRHPGHLFVQLLRLLPAGGGQQRGAPGVSGGVGAAEHRPGPVVRPGAGAQRGRRRRSHRHLPVRLGHRHPALYPGPAAASSGALGRHLHIRAACLREVASYSFLTCIQQSVMNLGILMVQGLVNSFGPTIMAAFAAAVKIDSFAYLPVQDFGQRLFHLHRPELRAAKQSGRIRAGLKGAVAASMGFGVVLSALVWVFAAPLMGLFVEAGEAAVIAEGVLYLHIEGAFYCGIGCLFLLYGLYRALGKPGMSVVLTVISLGTRVALAYLLSATPLGVTGIWWSVPIGWALADARRPGLLPRPPEKAARLGELKKSRPADMRDGRDTYREIWR